MKIPLFTIGIGLMLLCACGNGGEPATDGEEKDDRMFRTTPPSLLYFKNMRSTNYSVEEHPNTRVELYRLRRFGETTQHPLLIPLIANNWMEDEAYLFIEPNKFEGGFYDTLRVFWSAGDDSSGVYELARAGLPQQYEFARGLAESMRKGHELRVLTAEADTVPIFDDQASRSHFLTTVRDYERLTEQD